MKKIKMLIVTLGLICGLGIFVPSYVGAVSALDDVCKADSTSTLCTHKDDDLMNYVKIIINTLMFALGAISVVMIILGGIKYTTSMGDAKNVESAKNTIMYAVIGLVVAVLAFAIVNFVIGKLG